MTNLSPELEKLTEQLFKEFTEILVKHDITANQADWLTMCFNSRWQFLPLTPLEPIQEVLQKISLATYFRKESEIKRLFDQAFSDLCLLIGQGAGEKIQTG